MAAARRFTFVPMGSAPSRELLAIAASCDGLVPGAALDLSHWEGNATPEALKRDTSTEIALAFVKSGGSIEVAANNHFDADGALAVYALLRSDVALAHEAVLVAAAEAGDFDEWPDDDRGLKLEAAVRRMALLKTDAAAYERVLRELEGVLANLDAREDLWGEDWRALERSHAKIVRGDVQVAVEGPLATLMHPRGTQELRGPALHRAVRHAAKVLRVPMPTAWLLSFERDEGTWDYRYERARHAWADTVVRPHVAPPGRNAIATRLSRALGVPFEAFALKKDLPMTGVFRTEAPIASPPETVSAALVDGSRADRGDVTSIP